MDEKLIDRLSQDLANYLRMSCFTDWTNEDIARFLRMEYGMLDLKKQPMTPIHSRMRPDGFWYAAIKRYRDNPNDYQVIEYFATKVDCYDYIRQQPKSSLYSLEPARYE